MKKVTFNNIDDIKYYYLSDDERQMKRKVFQEIYGKLSNKIDICSILINIIDYGRSSSCWSSWIFSCPINNWIFGESCKSEESEEKDKKYENKETLL